MAQPAPYNRLTSFQTIQQQFPSDPLPGDELDGELNSVKVTVDQILENLALLQRDDGELANQIVGFDQLAPELSLGFSAPAPWATATVYSAHSSVFFDGRFYLCLVPHTSGIFAVDIANAKWSLIADFTVLGGYFHATSTTSQAILTGTKSFTVESGRFFGVGDRVSIANDSTHLMSGRVTAYAGTNLTVDVDVVVGSGTFASWVVRIAGERGPIGATGGPGAAATIAVGTVTTGAPGSSALVSNSGSSAAAVLDFQLPSGVAGPAATVAAGTVTTGAPGSSAAVANAGSSSAAVFNFTIPRGDVGAAATVAVGSVTTGAPGSSATVTNVGTSGAAVLNFSIPAGDPGLLSAADINYSNATSGLAATKVQGAIDEIVATKTTSIIVGRIGAVNIVDYGADASGSGSSQTALVNALASGFNVFAPSGNFKLTDRVALANAGQKIFGAGRAKTTFKVNSATFNMAANSVFDITSGETGPELSDFGMDFTQPNPSTAAVDTMRNNLAQYPPAIRMLAQPRTRLSRIRIFRAWQGIVTTGNSGGTNFEDLELCAFERHIHIDGCADTFRIGNVHIWPFGALTTNQMSIFQNTGNTAGTPTYGITTGRCDGLAINGLLTLCGLGLLAFSGTGGNTFGTIVNSHFDTGSGIKVLAAASLSVAGCYFTANGDAIAINNIADSTTVTGSWFSGNGTVATNGMLQVDGSTAHITATGNYFNAGAADRPIVRINSGQVIVNGNDFFRTANTAYGHATIEQVSGRVRAFGNTQSDKGTARAISSISPLTTFTISSATLDRVGPMRGRAGTPRLASSPTITDVSWQR
jgi:hypothetical protein